MLTFNAQCFSLYLYYSFRRIESNGDIYEGGTSGGVTYGCNFVWQGETEYYEDGRVEKGHWENGYRQGVFECKHKDGTLEIKQYDEHAPVYLYGEDPEFDYWNR